MAAAVLRLRLALALGSLRGPRAGARLLGLLLTAAVTIVTVRATIALGEGSAAAQHTIIVLAGTIVMLGSVLGVIITRMGDQLAPRRFSTLHLPSLPLAGVLLLAMPLGVGALAFALVCAVAAVVWTSQGVPWPTAWASMLLAFATALLTARLTMAATIRLRERRSGELTTVLVLILIVVLAPAVLFAVSRDFSAGAPAELAGAVSLLGHTPLAAAWAIPGLVATGASTGSVALAVTVALLTLLAAVGAWLLVVAAAMHRPERRIAARERSRLGWFALLPTGPAGAIAARSLSYWLRDRRYLVNLTIIPFASVVPVVPLVLAGAPAEWTVLIPVLLMALLFGWMPHNDVAFDSTALWLHIVSGTRGAADRIGRLAPITLISVPVLAVAISVTALIADDFTLVPALAGVTAALLLGGLGISSVTSALAPYPVTRPGDGAFSQPQRSVSGMGVQALVMLGAVLIAAPTAWLAGREHFGGEDVPSALWIGLGSGAAALIVGVTVGAIVFSARAPRLMEFAQAS